MVIKHVAMKKTFLLLLLTGMAGFFSTLSAQDYKTAVGVRLSSAGAAVNNSVSVKQFLHNNTAVEALFSFGDPLALGAMLEKHKPLASSGLSYYYGAGGYLSFVKTFDPTKNRNITDPNFGGMGVIGLDYKFAQIPLNISLDWKPELNIVKEINFEPSAIGFTARFTF